MHDEAQMDELVAQLAVDTGNIAEDAQFSLQESFGYQCVPTVIEALPELPEWGQTCALDLLVRLTVAPVPTQKLSCMIEQAAITMLDSNRELLRQYSAEILQGAGSNTAIPHLLRVLERSRTNSTPQDWSEPICIRAALRKLGHSTRYESNEIESKMANAFFFE